MFPRFHGRALLCFALMLGPMITQSVAQLSRVNLAKFQLAQASSAAGGYPAVLATDGIVGNGNRWKSSGTGPHTLTVTLPLAMELGSAHLYLGRDDIEPVASFVLQSWTGSAWVNIPGTATIGNTNNILNLVFISPVITSRVRFFSADAEVRLREIALFPPNGLEGYPIGTDVTLNLAKKRLAIGSSQGLCAGVLPGDRGAPASRDRRPQRRARRQPRGSRCRLVRPAQDQARRAQPRT
jgi:hypothetical protein